MTKIAVLLLAAGNASRMGSPKQLLKWKETTLLQHAINNAEQLDSGPVLIVLGANYEVLEKAIETKKAIVIRNAYWEEGLGSSIACGVDYIKQSLPDVDAVLILLIDQPLVDTSILNKLIDVYKSHGNVIACTQYEPNQFGVPAVFNKMYFDELSQLKHDQGAKSVLQKYADLKSCLNGKDFIADIDSKEDYENLYKKFH